MSTGFMVFAEQRGGRLKKAVFEAIGAAMALAEKVKEPVGAVLIGHQVEGLAKDLSRYGADRIYWADDPLLKDYSSEAYATILCNLLTSLQPRAFLLGATSMGKDLAPKVAARLKTCLITDCISIDLNDQGQLIATRPIYGGKIRAEVMSNLTSLQVATLRQNVFTARAPDETGAASTSEKLDRLSIQLDVSKLKARVKEIQATAGTRIELTEASIIVSGGRGLKGPENFKIVEELARALGAAVGASRAAVDAGWKPHPYQVGLTGKTVSPLLYIACGISGAIQHQAGMSSSRYIVGINKDPEAPIFKIANYGIVGDVFEVVPLLTQEIKKVKGE
jgi:electron transfer flavoprotein alpha subunit